MAGSNRETSLIQAANTNHLYPALPLATSDNAHLNIAARIGYLYDSSRGLRHENAQNLLLAIYNYGADLINKGLAYNIKNFSPGQLLTAEALPSENRLIADSLTIQESKEKKAQSVTPMRSTTEQTQDLLRTYHQLPETYCNDGTKKQLHALFIMKVALDHLPAQGIYQALRKMWNQTAAMTIDHRTRINLPNGSSFSNDHAITDILSLYIDSNYERFSNNPDYLQSIAREQAFKKKHGISSYSPGLGFSLLNIYILDPSSNSDDASAELRIRNLMSRASLPTPSLLLEASPSRVLIEEVQDEKPSTLQVKPRVTEPDDSNEKIAQSASKQAPNLTSVSQSIAKTVKPVQSAPATHPSPQKLGFFARLWRRIKSLTLMLWSLITTGSLQAYRERQSKNPSSFNTAGLMSAEPRFKQTTGHGNQDKQAPAREDKPIALPVKNREILDDNKPSSSLQINRR